MSKIVIVGGVAGGATAAARIRRLDEKAEIVVFERSGYVSYANCGLPYYVGGVITDAEELTLQTPESFRSRFAIDMRVHHEVTAIHTEEKTVSVHNLETGERWEESYDKLLLTPGAKPIVPDLAQKDDPRVFTLRTVEDTLKMRAFCETQHPRKAVIVGGGFIGLELAENLTESGVSVTVADLQPQVMGQIDPEMAAFVHDKLIQKGVTLALGRSVRAIRTEPFGVELGDGTVLEADMAVLAIGVSPESALAKEAGLMLGLRGSIVVNDRMETSAKDVYAVGDAVQVKHFVSGADAMISLAGPANKQARVAADNICGRDSRYLGAQGSSVLKLFDLTVAATGINERTAKAMHLDCEKVYLSPMSHAGYYPGGKVMTMKVLFDPKKDRLLGAQIVGGEGADKRIDVLAAAIRMEMPASKLSELELAYAPPYSSAKDPVNMAGCMIENIETGTLAQFHWDEVASLPRDGSVTLLDVRTEEEYAAGHIDGFSHIPVDDLRERMGELDPKKPLYVMCQSGLRSYIACRILMQNGFACRNLSGGYRLYRTAVKNGAAAERAMPCGKE